MQQNFLRKDLNLLKALYVLLEEGSVKEAAEKLFITPSALSKALGRLRTTFDDPLLVNNKGKLDLTQKGKELQEMLNEIIIQIEALYANKIFDPSLFDGNVNIAAPEQFSFAIIPTLVVNLREKSPRLVIDSEHLGDNYQQKLSDGTLDFAIVAENKYPQDYFLTKLYSVKPMCWSRKNHPFTKGKRIEFSDIFSYPIIRFRAHKTIQSMSQEARYFLKNIAKEKKLKADILLNTSHLLTALGVLLKTDALMLAPDYVSLLPSFEGKIVAHDLSHIAEFDQFQINLSLLQHRRTLKSPLHQWISKEILHIFSSDVFNTSATEASTLQASPSRGVR